MENLTPFSNSISGMVLMLAIGLRHGIDPDHIAIIDGMTMKHNLENSKWTKWVGTLFAIGHGLVITIVAMFLSQMTSAFNFANWLTTMAAWIPILLLILVGTLNLISLLNKQSYEVIGWRAKLLPKKIINSTNPFAIILVGVLFATLFDIATQASVSSFAASQKGEIYIVALMGLIFTIGMVITDTIDNRILFRILYKSNNLQYIKQYRLYLGWAIVFISYLMAAYKIVSILVPSFILNDQLNSLVGLSFILLMLSSYIVILFKNSKNKFNVG